MRAAAVQWRLTQRELGELLGLHPQTVSKIVCDRAEVPLRAYQWVLALAAFEKPTDEQRAAVRRLLRDGGAPFAWGVILTALRLGEVRELARCGREVHPADLGRIADEIEAGVELARRCPPPVPSGAREAMDAALVDAATIRAAAAILEALVLLDPEVRTS